MPSPRRPEFVRPLLAACGGGKHGSLAVAAVAAVIVAASVFPMREERRR